MDKTKEKKDLIEFICLFVIVPIIVLIVIFCWVVFFQETRQGSCAVEAKTFIPTNPSKLIGNSILTMITLTMIVFIDYKIASFGKNQILFKKSFYIFMLIVYIVLFTRSIVSLNSNLNNLNEDIERWSKRNQSDLFLRIAYAKAPNPEDIIKDDELKIKYAYLDILIVPVSYLLMNGVFFLDRKMVKRKMRDNES